MAALVALACSESPQQRLGQAGGARLQLVADLAGTRVRTLVVEVSAPDIQPALLFNLPDTNGVASGTLTVPPGAARTFVVRAYDSTGTETHDGQTTIDVRAGLNPIVTITLLPLAGSQPIDVRIGNLLVTVAPYSSVVLVGDTVALTVRVTDLVGNPIAVDSAALRWSTLDPRIATVTTTGVVRSAAPGAVQIVASYAGSAGAVAVTVLDSARIVGAGDIGECSLTGVTLTAGVLDTTAGAVLAIGDNAYPDGTLANYQKCYDPTWGAQNYRVRPVPGNHEYHVTGAAAYWQYFTSRRVFVGDSGSYYYSYDLGAWHIVALNSEISVIATSPEVVWLQKDLAATAARCVLAYFHTPLFSSDSVHGNNTKLQPIWQVLYNAGVDVVLNGHAHDYERFAPQTPTGVLDTVAGIREIVVGTGGGTFYPFKTIQPNSQVRIAKVPGVIRMTLAPTSYSWQFVRADNGTIADSGTTSCH